MGGPSPWPDGPSEVAGRRLSGHCWLPKTRTCLFGRRAARENQVQFHGPQFDRIVLLSAPTREELWRSGWRPETSNSYGKAPEELSRVPE